MYLNTNNPIAVIKVKDNNHTVSHVLQQAREYARMLDLPFAFSSNGDGFVEHDFLTDGVASESSLAWFGFLNFATFRPPHSGGRRQRGANGCG